MKKIMIAFSAILFLLVFVGCSDMTSSTQNTTNTQTTTKTMTTKSTKENTTKSETTTKAPELTEYDRLFEDENFKKITIEFTKENFNELVDNMEAYYDKYGTFRDNTMVKCNVKYEDEYGELNISEVGFRSKGNIYSRKLPVETDKRGNVIGYNQIHFQLEFNEIFDYQKGSDGYKNLKGRRCFGVEQVNFKFIRDNEEVITEQFAYDIYKSADLIAPNSSYTLVVFKIGEQEINYGLYVIIEAIDDIFVERYYNTPKKEQDNLYKCVYQRVPAALNVDIDYSYDIGVADQDNNYRPSYALKTNKDNPNYTDLTDLIFLSCTENKTEFVNNIEEHLNVNQFLKALAVSFYVGSGDDLRGNGNNYYLYFKDGKAEYIPYDTDQCLGTGWHHKEEHGIYLDLFNYAPDFANHGKSYKSVLLIDWLMSIKEYKDTYAGYLKEMLSNEMFSYQEYRNHYTLIRTMYEEELQTDNHLGITKFKLTENVSVFDNYFKAKKAEIEKQLLDYLN